MSTVLTLIVIFPLISIMILDALTFFISMWLQIVSAEPIGESKSLVYSVLDAHVKEHHIGQMYWLGFICFGVFINILGLVIADFLLSMNTNFITTGILIFLFVFITISIRLMVISYRQRKE